MFKTILLIELHNIQMPIKKSFSNFFYQYLQISKPLPFIGKLSLLIHKICKKHRTIDYTPAGCWDLSKWEMLINNSLLLISIEGDTPGDICKVSILKWAI